MCLHIIHPIICVDKIAIKRVAVVDKEHFKQFTITIVTSIIFLNNQSLSQAVYSLSKSYLSDQKSLKLFYYTIIKLKCKPIP